MKTPVRNFLPLILPFHCLIFKIHLCPRAMWSFRQMLVLTIKATVIEKNTTSHVQIVTAMINRLLRGAFFTLSSYFEIFYALFLTLSDHSARIATPQSSISGNSTNPFSKSWRSWRTKTGSWKTTSRSCGDVTSASLSGRLSCLKHKLVDLCLETFADDC